MSIEHEQRCERTIVTTVHEIDGLKHELALTRLALARVRALCDNAEVIDGTVHSPRTVLIDDIYAAMEEAL
ncbi:hypothetical protein CH274_13380 [Rhodococcus sp. 06-418-5]|uniref:hypothetical protein n=1 Tax=Rhodococcus sp. 06-418-5 TaxID=2022507 RepID=UPI000B9B5F20|nr:hypothetical protein [Rhodococcus sp. 06-418-5]OZC80221.1 hypothetical protein CH274_13380 [Rhodococcus sp. 06-418-5]